LRKIGVVWIAVIALAAMTAIAQSISIQLDAGAFKVTGWTPPRVAPAKGWGSTLSIYAGVGDVPALLGSYAVENGMLVFHPQFPIAAGVQYRAVFQPPGGSPITRTFDGPRRDTTPAARVLHVYPSSDVLPSNQLRLYIYFSAPMSRGEAAQRIHILDERGKALEGAEAVLLRGQELWDPKFERLTMTFDPGRIKRELTSNKMIGPPIAEGKRYTLVIDREWPDARGVPMVEGFRKPFRGGPAQRTTPDPKQWRVTSPAAGGAGAVVVDFPTPMNFPLLQRMIQVTGPQGNIAGVIDVERQETQWRFTPREAWKPGAYRLVIDTGLEDLAGNHIGQLFDIDVFERVTEHITTSAVSLPFTIR
jgi:hypothetical protein